MPAEDSVLFGRKNEGSPALANGPHSFTGNLPDYAMDVESMSTSGLWAEGWRLKDQGILGHEALALTVRLKTLTSKHFSLQSSAFSLNPWGSSTYHGQEHLEPHGRTYGMGLIGRHDYHLPGPNCVFYARDGDLRLSFNNLHDCVKGRGMLAQPLPLVEGEQRYRPYPFVLLTTDPSRYATRSVKVSSLPMKAPMSLAIISPHDKCRWLMNLVHDFINTVSSRPQGEIWASSLPA
jgi:hypothetical protein